MHEFSETFPYWNALAAGRPLTDSVRHPRMPIPHRAKIFQPFDALEGFSVSIAAMGRTYTDRIIPSETSQAELSRKIAFLRRLTRNRKSARENCIDVKITYFVPCSDPANPSFRTRGSYQITEGICQRVDSDESCTIQVNDTNIPIRDILSIDLKGNELADF